jgi:hypothetical protein
MKGKERRGKILLSMLHIVMMEGLSVMFTVHVVLKSDGINFVIYLFIFSFEVQFVLH